MEAVLERAIIAIGRLYFMTIMNGRKKPIHLSRLNALVEKCGLARAKSMQAFTSLEELRANSMVELIEEHAYFLSHCLSSDIPVINCQFDFTHIDECARPVIAYLTLNFQNLSPQSNLEHFNRLLTGMRIPSSSMLDLRILLHLYEYEPMHVRKFRLEQYERLLVPSEELNRVWHYRPRVEGRQTITREVVAPVAAARLRPPQRTAVKMPPVPRVVAPKIKIEPEIAREPDPDITSDEYEPKAGRSDDDFELRPKRTPPAGAARKRVYKEPITYDFEPVVVGPYHIDYMSCADTIVGTRTSDCFQYGKYIAVPINGMTYSVAYPGIENMLDHIDNVSATRIPGRFYLINPDELFHVSGVVSTKVDLHSVEKIIVRI